MSLGEIGNKCEVDAGSGELRIKGGGPRVGLVYFR
jgi:hypothetical protein